MNDVMLLEVNELARYYTAADAARCLGLPEARIRDWQRKGIAPSLTKGMIQFSRADVVRMFALDQLQGIFGATAVATELARALTVEALEAVLSAEAPQAVAKFDGRTYRVDLDPSAVTALRARMSTVPQ